MSSAAPRHTRDRANRTIALLAIMLFASVAAWRTAFSQEPMVVSGRVTVAGRAVPGADVEIPQVHLSGSTDGGGYYSFLIPVLRLTGGPATVVVRHVHLGRRTAVLVLTGGSVVRDFDFESPDSTAIVALAGAPRVRPRPPTSGSWLRTVDSTSFGEAAGPLDLAAASAGHVPGLLVTSANSPGATSLMVFRGVRSLSGAIQPLVVLDGVPIDNSSSATATQRFGLGGFDYGSSLQDIPLEDIADVRLLTGAEAAPFYGARASNGVLLVTSKHARSVTGFEVSASMRRTAESPIRLPVYQNSYGQGLGGAFAFFDGAGGGINDGVDQSWGPALQGQLVAQASATEPRQADVRPWLPHPASFRDYFGHAQTFDVNTVVHAAAPWGDLRAALNARSADGLTPSSALRRLGVTVTGALHLSPRLLLDLNLRALDGHSDGRPGTGFGEINPVAGFTRIGRQVDLALLRQHLTTSGAPINWIYTDRNNPYVQPLLNSEYDQRTHLLGGATASFDAGRGVRLLAHVGGDNDDQKRDFDVAPGWQGAYPTALGLLDFSRGGTQRQTLALRQSSASFGFETSADETRATSATLAAGVEYRNDSWTVHTLAGGAGNLRGDTTSATTTVPAAYATTVLTLKDALRLSAGVRAEAPSSGPTELYPAVNIAYDLVPGAKRGSPALATLHAAWWRSGNELTRRSLAGAYAGGDVPCPGSCPGGAALQPVTGIVSSGSYAPELTEGIEGGTALAVPGDRVAIDITAYHEQSSNVLLAVSGAGALRTGVIVNDGIEGGVRISAVQRPSFAWELFVEGARNVNRLHRAADGIGDIALGPTIWGAALVARVGEPLGTIVGTGFLRDDATGSLLLGHGLPIPTATRSVLGSWQPAATASAGSTMRLGPAELSLLLDARIGGHLFSATNLGGSWAGTLEATSARPAAGRIIAGVDSATRTANTVAVSTEDYFHALGAIDEAWVYDASFIKLRQARLSWTVPLSAAPVLRQQAARITVIGRNLVTWAKAPNIDPETTLSTEAFQGFEMGQLPTTRSLGLQISLTP